jgi:hypothetical protein
LHSRYCWGLLLFACCTMRFFIDSCAGQPLSCESCSSFQLNTAIATTTTPPPLATYLSAIPSLTIVPDRLYLAAYIHPPTADTLFPSSSESPRKRALRAAEGQPPSPSPKCRSPPCYFTIDDTLLYNAFHHDFGPLHIGHLYRFAIRFHDILGAKENKDRPVVFWSAADPRSECSLRRLALIY